MTVQPTEEDYEKAKELVEALTLTRIELLKTYAALNEKAKTEKITADDYNRAEKELNERTWAIRKDVSELLDKLGIPTTDNTEQLKNFSGISNDRIEKWKSVNPEIIEAIANVKNLDDAFRRDYLTNSPQKNLTIPENTDTPEKLLATLLQNNTGVAIGDWHSKTDSIYLIHNNMKTLKNAGVDTIYLELDEPSFSNFKLMSIAELQDKLNNRTPEERKRSAEINAKNNHTKEADDDFGANLHLFLSAKENGINIVNIDKIGSARVF